MPPTDPLTASAASAATPTGSSPVGLRERKKAQTRAAIQHQALRLFRESGYSATTMEQIAAAADVSPSTLYRYFPTKEDLILQDDYDPLLVAAFLAQPRDLPPLEAFRAALSEAKDQIPPEELEEALERAYLSYTIPEVRARAIDHMLVTHGMLSDLFAERLHRSAEELEVKVLAGTVIGALLAAQELWIADRSRDLYALLDRSLHILINNPGGPAPGSQAPNAQEA